jgi:hypothetical protein
MEGEWGPVVKGEWVMRLCVNAFTPIPSDRAGALYSLDRHIVKELA